MNVSVSYPLETSLDTVIDRVSNLGVGNAVAGGGLREVCLFETEQKLSSSK